MTPFSTENLNGSELTARQIYIRCMRCPTAVPRECGSETSGLKATRHTSIPSFPCATRHPLLKEAVNTGFGDVQSKRAVLLPQTPRRQGLGRFDPLRTTKMRSEPTVPEKRLRSLYGLWLWDLHFSSRSTNCFGFASFSETLLKPRDTSFVH